MQTEDDKTYAETTITNTYDEQKFCLTVLKVWNDQCNKFNTRPDTITVQLYKKVGDGAITGPIAVATEVSLNSDGTDYTRLDASTDVVLKKDNNWTAVILGVDKYEDGKLVQYYWKEKTVPAGYTLDTTGAVAVTIGEGDNAVTTYYIPANEGSTRIGSITNEQLGSLKLTKVVTINGDPIDEVSEALQSKADGTYTFKVYTDSSCADDKLATKADGSEIGDIVITIENGAVASATVNGSEVTLEADNSVEIADLSAGDYWVKETAASNGAVTMDDTAHKVTVVAGQSGANVAAAGKATFTNDYETTQYDVKKTWGNNQDPPEGAEIKITLSGLVLEFTEYEPFLNVYDVNLSDLGVTPTVTLNGGATGGNDTIDKSWEYSWTNLPKYDSQGRAIIYTAAETEYKIGNETIAITGDGALEPTTSDDATYELIITNKIPTTSIKAKGLLSDGQGCPGPANHQEQGGSSRGRQIRTHQYC